MAFVLKKSHLVWLLVLFILLESLVLYLQRKIEPAPHPREKLSKVHHSPRKRRGSDKPRIGIITLQSQKGPTNSKGLGPTNSKTYSHQHSFDFVDGSKSVAPAVETLKAAGADPSFVRLFAILKFLPLYDWVFWHDSDSLFLK